MCMVALYNQASVPARNMSKNDNLVLVAKEITGCYGDILVAMDTDMLPKGVDNKCPQNHH